MVRNCIKCRCRLDLEKFYELKLNDKENSFVFDANYRNIKIEKNEIKELFKLMENQPKY